MKKLHQIPHISSFCVSKIFILLGATLLCKVALADFQLIGDHDEVTYYSEENNSYVGVKIYLPKYFYLIQELTLIILWIVLKDGI